MTSGATPRYGAITKATGREIAMAATFMMTLVMSMTKNAMPMTNRNQLAPSNFISHFTASHLAAPVSQRQKPKLMAPAKRRMMSQGISSRSSTLRMPVIKNKIVDVTMMAVLSKGFRAGIKERRDITRTQDKMIQVATISFLVIGPSSLLSRMALCRRPGITFFSGLKKIMKKPQSRKTMSHPTGNM